MFNVALWKIGKQPKCPLEKYPEKYSFCLELSASVMLNEWNYGSQFRSPGKLHQNQFKPLENSNLQTFPPTFLQGIIFFQGRPGILHSPLYRYKMELLSLYIYT